MEDCKNGTLIKVLTLFDHATHTTHTHTYIYIYIYICSPCTVEHSGEGIYGYHSYNAKPFKGIEHSGIW